MARVFDAFDERLERPAAVKILRAETRADARHAAAVPAGGLIAARLVHPHIVAVLDFGEDDASSYLVMERLPGSTLRDEIMARGPCPRAGSLLVMAETLAALAAAHRRRAAPRHQAQQHPAAAGRAHEDHRLRHRQELRQRTDACPLTRRHDDDRGRARDAGLSGAGTQDGPSRHRAIGPVLGRRGHGRGAHGPAPRSRRRTGRAAPAAVPRCRPPRPGRRSARTLHLGRRHAAGARRHGAPTCARSARAVTATRPTTASAATATTAGDRGTAASSRRPRSAAPRGTRSGLTDADGGAAWCLAALSLLPPRRRRLPPPRRRHSTRRCRAAAATHHAARPRTQAVTRSSATQVPTPRAPPSRPSPHRSPTGAARVTGRWPAPCRRPPRNRRAPIAQASAQQALSLAGVLLDGAASPPGQYQDVVDVLQPTGATVTTTTTAPPTPAPPFQAPFFQGHGHGHGHGRRTRGSGVARPVDRRAARPAAPMTGLRCVAEEKRD